MICVEIWCRCGSDWFSCGADVVQGDVWCIRMLDQWWFNLGSDVGQSGYRQVVVHIGSVLLSVLSQIWFQTWFRCVCGIGVDG